MNLHDYELVKNYDHSTYCNHLLEKYGVVGGDYFTSTFSQNMTIKRADEGLYIHHIDEDKVANLSNYEVARANSFDYQKADHLVYADLFEHILLHILIGEQNKGLGFGGAEIMLAKANDMIWDKEKQIVLFILKERCRVSLETYINKTLLPHNQTVFYELIDTLDKYNLAFLDLGPGLGKTTTALACARKYGVKALVLGPNTTITKGWAGEEDAEPHTYAWFMNNYTSIDYSKYGILICDEAHHLSGKRWREGVEYVKQNKLLKIAGLTGTPNKACRDFFENKECKGFSVLDGIEREIIHDFSYIGAIFDTSGIKDKYADISDKTLLGELDLALNNTPTVKTIITKHMPSNKRKGIIFVSNIAAMDEAEEIMRDIYPNAEYRRMHSLMPDNEVRETREWFQNTDEGYLLAVNMISEGAHYKGVNTIIMFRRTQSSLVFNQQLGRIITLVRDENPHAIVFDLVNNAENLDAEKGFSASLRESYAQRKARGGKEKSEQIIVEDYAEAISDVLGKIREYLIPGDPIYRLDANYHIVKEYSRVGKTAEDGFKPNDVSQALMGKINNVNGWFWCFVKDYYEEWRPKVNAKKRIVLCIETQELFCSITAAEQKNGGDVMATLLRKQHTANGYHYAYADDKERITELKEFVGKPRQVYQKTRKVRLKNTGEVFESAAAAVRKYPQANRTGIGNCCMGKQKSCGKLPDGTKLEWEFVE